MQNAYKRLFLMLTISSNYSPIFSADDANPAKLIGGAIKSLVPSEQTQDDCCLFCLGMCCLAAIVGGGTALYDKFNSPQQSALCIEQAPGIHKWHQDGFTPYDFNKFFTIPQTNNQDSYQVQCATSLSAYLNEEILEKVPKCPQDQITDDVTHRCSTLDNLLVQNEKHHCAAAQIIRNTVEKIRSHGDFTAIHTLDKARNSNIGLIRRHQARLKCANMAEEDVQKLAAEEMNTSQLLVQQATCETLKTQQKNTQTKYDATVKNSADQRVHAATLKMISEKIHKEKCD